MQSETKNDQEKMPDVNREDWSVEKLTQESANQSGDETLRQVLRGDESNGDADARDMVGGSAANDTPQGREEAKSNKSKNDSEKND